MATDTLEVCGTERTNVAGFKVTDDNNQTKTYIRPQGTKSITTNGIGIDVSAYALADVSVSGGSPVLQTKSKSYTPSETAQSEAVTYDIGYDGLDTVNISVGAISSTYVGSGIAQRDSSNLSASGATVTAPSGYYASNATKTVSSGTAGTPTATKGAVNNHSISVTPSVTNTTGYITGGTKTGTAVTVSASELVSGSETKTVNGTYDVTNLATLIVNVAGGGSSKNVQIVQQNSTRITATSYTKACGDITVSKTGTYDVYWSSYRTSSSGTWGTQLYIDSSAYGNIMSTFQNSYFQTVHLTSVSLTQNQVLSVYGRSRGSNYYLYVGQLVIIES